MAKSLGEAIRAIAISIAYLAIIVPAAGILRLFGGDPLRLRPHESRRATWRCREEAAGSELASKDAGKMFEP